MEGLTNFRIRSLKVSDKTIKVIVEFDNGEHEVFEIRRDMNEALQDGEETFLREIEIKIKYEIYWKRKNR